MPEEGVTVLRVWYQVVEEIKALGAEAVAIKADVSKPEEVDALFKATKEAFSDPVSILVNNAGTTTRTPQAGSGCHPFVCHRA